MDPSILFLFPPFFPTEPSSLRFQPKPHRQTASSPDLVLRVFQEASPGFGIVTQRPDGKGAMVNGIEPGGDVFFFHQTKQHQRNGNRHIVHLCSVLHLFSFIFCQVTPKAA